MSHCFPGAQLDCDLTMSIHCELLILILTLTLGGQVHTGEVIGGHEAVPHSRPYMVLLERHMQHGKTKHCGGFLLSEDFVMTAAHCQASSYTVLLGVDNFRNSNGVQHISVDQAFPRKDYNETDFSNDIMLLKLRSKAKFNKNVRPIALAGQGDGSLPKSCIVSGWGRTNKDISYMSVVLMEVNVTLTERCPNTNLYCSEGETGPGKGDSGGPLVCEDGKAYGVVSHNFRPHSGDPEIHCFAKIPDYRSWIKLIMPNE
ncbi:granzyme B(G,H)-like [Etheostoma cragini]|uniref:granzyme B(G,H)-like n=1 Tax=Etheostoma cragini TaxID=417921 RepID=UPI00155EF255|nr:granzyme B(G,H)-like [Etheostoma cragini]XP_034737207.1 granzyme B(G,H)-like [Etheostoma cragini]